MNQQTVAGIFSEFFETHLAPLGFVRSTPTLAERVLTGFKQIIRWNLTASSFDLSVQYSYTHDLDDALSIAASDEEPNPDCSGYVPILHMRGSFTEDAIKSDLNSVHRKLRNTLNRTQSVDKIITAVNDDMTAGVRLLGHDPMGMSFNYAYCMDFAGKKREAAKRYADLSGLRRSNRSVFATRVREAARERAIALKSYLPKDVTEHLVKPTPTDAARQSIVADAISETELAKRIIALGFNPETVLPGLFLEVVVQAYSPATTFWFNVDAERLVSELESQQPTYMATVNRIWAKDGCGSFNEDLVNAIRTKQFDEYSAKWLLSLPQEKVSNDDDHEVYDLLHRHLKRTRNLEMLRYLELDGVKAIGYIRDRMDLMLS
ncbi:hypothetical protein [Paraburkholderia tropica]|uniref:hypothetical protein n=1 Tax=Paraburkholderia tropica TaxID=92647 RepID=UPI0015925BC8|nr:hypothetical protein [Paraburkholderia tropica]